MNLGIFLTPGDSLQNFSKSGQADRFIKFFIIPYSKEFNKVYLFSYSNENWDLPSNVILVTNTSNMHRLIYALLLPILHLKKILDCNVIRGFGIASSISAFLCWRPFVFNWAYDYVSFVKVDRKYFYIPFYIILERLAFLRAQKILIATKQKMQSLTGKKFIYFPNGVDLSLFKPEASASPKLLFIGRFEKQKNLKFLIEALALLPEKYRKISLIGFGSQEKDLKKMAKRKQISLQIIKPMPNTKLAKFICKYSILLLPSLHEGIPKVLIEAMAIGLVPGGY